MPANRPNCPQAGQRSVNARPKRIQIFSSVECSSGLLRIGCIGRDGMGRTLKTPGAQTHHTRPPALAKELCTVYSKDRESPCLAVLVSLISPGNGTAQ